MINRNKSGYSIIIAIFVIWFLLTLTAAILKLVVAELNDNRGVYNYLKTYYATSWAGEYVMLKIKENWYWYYDKVLFDKNNPISNILNYNDEKNPIISYDINSKVKQYSGNIWPLWYDVIPLFYIEDNWSWALLDMSLSSTGTNIWDLSWNIISKNWWLSWEWWFSLNSEWYLKQLDSNSEFIIETKTIWDFLNENKNDFNYLVLFNSSENSQIIYNLDWNWGFFTKPRTEISVSSKISNYKQNISIKYDNTEYLWMLKYSIYND